MNDTIKPPKEYDLSDFGRVFLFGWKKILGMFFAVGILFAVTLSCVALVITHEEYTVVMAKIDTDYDVPVVRSVVKERIDNVLSSRYGDCVKKTTLAEFCEELDENLKISEIENGVYTFTLQSFCTDVSLDDDGFAGILSDFTARLEEEYLKKIKDDYAVALAAFDGVLSLNYYLQTERLLSSVEYFLGAIDSILAAEGRSGFSGYACRENGATISDCIQALEIVKEEIVRVQEVVSVNAIEKENTAPMSEYIQGRLLYEPNNSTWLELAKRFQLSPVYDAEAAALAERLIDGVTSEIQKVAEEYDVLVCEYAESILSEYVVFSSFERKDVSVLSFVTVLSISLAAALIGATIGYSLQFYTMQKANQIGVIVHETADEP